MEHDAKAEGVGVARVGGGEDGDGVGEDAVGGGAESEVVGGEFLAGYDVRGYRGKVEERDLGRGGGGYDGGGGDLMKDFRTY